MGTVDGSTRKIVDGEFYLLGYQSAWVYDHSKTKIAEKGRQEGYTWATACESVILASTRVPDGGLDVYYMSTSQDGARDFIVECAEWVETLSPAIRASPDVDVYDWIDEENDPVAIQTQRLRFPSGLSIYALPSRPARMRGKKRCLAICDEASHHDLAAWLKATSATSMWGGRRAIMSTHHGTDSGFWQYVQRVRASAADGKPIASLHSVFLYDALRDGLYQRICRTAMPRVEWTQAGEDEWVEALRRDNIDVFDEEFLGIVAGASNQLIGRSLVLAAQILSPDECPIIEMCGGDRPRMWINGVLLEESTRPWPLPTEQVQDVASHDERTAMVRAWLDQHVAPLLMKINALGQDIHVGDDYGRTGDLSVKVIGTNDSQNRRAVRMVFELDRVPSKVQEQIADYCWPMLTRLRSGSGDGNGLGQSAAEHAKDMTRGKMVVTMRLPDAAFTRLVSRLEAGELALPRHGRDLADDLTSIKRKGSGIEAPKRRTDRGQQRHADAAYALAHFEHSIDTDGRVVPISTASKRPFRSLFPTRTR